jgi:hypothetical protein
MASLKIEPGGSDDVACDCCDRQSRTVSGFVYRGGDAAAAYFVQWTIGGVASHGANFDLIIGKWGEGTRPTDRCAVALEFRRTDNGPAFMVVDASGRSAGRSDLVGEALGREQVVGTPLAKIAFEFVDAVWVQDLRIREIVGDAG